MYCYTRYREIPTPHWISGKYYINRVGGLKITKGLWDLPKAYPRQKQLLKTSRDYTEAAQKVHMMYYVLLYYVTLYRRECASLERLFSLPPTDLLGKFARKPSGHQKAPGLFIHKSQNTKGGSEPRLYFYLHWWRKDLKKSKRNLVRLKVPPFRETMLGKRLKSFCSKFLL